MAPVAVALRLWITAFRETQFCDQALPAAGLDDEVFCKPAPSALMAGVPGAADKICPLAYPSICFEKKCGAINSGSDELHVLAPRLFIAVAGLRMPKVGETDLALLIRTMQPRLVHGNFVYCCVKDRRELNQIEPIVTVVEPEGLTAVLRKRDAEILSLPYVFESRLISLMVNSDLSAIGFIAIISNALASAGIPCNAVSGYHHDHLLVPVDAGQRALEILKMLTR